MVKRKQKTIKRQYIEQRRYTPISGFFIVLLSQLILMIPILNVLLYEMLESNLMGRKMWEGCFFNTEKVYLKEEAVKVDE